MEKEYGKLSADQFRRLINKLPEISAGAKELGEELRLATPEKVRAVLDKGIYWAAFYEVPFVEDVALGMYVLGHGDQVKEFAKAEDPQEALLRFMESTNDIEPVAPDGQELDLPSVLAAVVSMQYTIFSIMLYQGSMSALVEEAREGNDDSLFQAVRINRLATTCTSLGSDS